MIIFYSFNTVFKNHIRSDHSFLKILFIIIFYNFDTVLKNSFDIVFKII